MFNNGNVPLTMNVAPTGNGNGGFFGGDGSWVFILVLFALIFGGWGNGWGGYGNGGVQENYILTSDFSQLSKQISDTYNMTDRKFEGIANGLCSMGYETQGLINGVNTNIMQGNNAIQGQLSQCCCDLKQLNGETNYNIATQANMLDRSIANGFCQTNFNAQTNARDIIDSQNGNTRAILDKLCQMENNAKDEKIADLQAKNFDLRLAASQSAQNALLINELGPKFPVPSYNVPNPFCNCQCGQNVYGTTIA